MTTLKCKMCGGDLDVQDKASVGTCQYCGTKQTLPKFDDDKRANLYERASHFRRQNDFDKAAGIYETILNEDRTDAEAYWSLVLCKYGVEYVEDPATRKRIPTCNRTQYGSVLADEDYRQAITHADDAQRVLYEEEAKAIDVIQKGILEISSKEEPFDIFICYKESDENGRRTPDSVLAQDMYHQLTNEGLKVFFSRITLEDKLGTAYEPFIFAALQSSRIMVAVGTKPEYFNSVWVKNEWSRFLGLIKGGAQKTLIPAYKDMDPYSLPDEFLHLQAQDMGKLGFMQDLLRGVKKILAPAQSSAAAPAQAPVQGAIATTQSLMQRAFIELETGNWEKADDLMDQVLDVEPQNSRAYIGKLMAALGVDTEENLANATERLTDYADFQKAMRFADDSYRAKLQGYCDAVEDTLERMRKQAIFDAAMQAADKLNTCANDSASFTAFARQCRVVADQFASISGFGPATEWCKKMNERAARGDKMAADALKRENRKRLTKKLVKVAIFGGIALFLAWFLVVAPANRKAAAAKAQEKQAVLAKEKQWEEDHGMKRPKSIKYEKEKYYLCRVKNDVALSNPGMMEHLPKGQKPNDNLYSFTIERIAYYNGEKDPHNDGGSYDFGPKDSPKKLIDQWDVNPEYTYKIYKKLRDDPALLPGVLLEYSVADGKIINHGVGL